MGVRWEPADGWDIKPLPRRRAGGIVGTAVAGSSDPFLDRLLAEGRSDLAGGLTATPTPRRGVAPGARLSLSVDGAAGEAYTVFVRHASGAIVFHAPVSEERAKRTSRGPAGASFHFSVPVASRRGSREPLRLRHGIVHVFVLRALGRLADKALPRLAASWETARWQDGEPRLGLVRVTPEGLVAGRLPQARPGSLPAPPGRSLLFLHGIFSSAEAAFRELAELKGGNGAALWPALRELYGERIFAFNHFTVSKTPEENARELLAVLPAGGALFDVVTHSRGGVVLRTLVERSGALGGAAARFRLGRAVLVASPNGGSPLASGAAWETAIGWVANLLDMFPANPLSLGLSLVAEGVLWIARRATGVLPGVAALGSDSAFIRELQGPPGPPPDAYSALTASFALDASLLERMADAGLGLLFPSAHDLVVPTEGGWRVDAGAAAAPVIPGNRIACFGPGGNLDAAVNHISFFGRPETADFLLRALRGEAHALRPLDPGADLPHGRKPARRGARESAGVHARGKRPAGPAAPPGRERRPERPPSSRHRASRSGDDALQLVLLGAGPSTPALLLATYGAARAVEPFGTKGGAAGQRMRRLIAFHERVLANLRNTPGAAPLPEGKELRDYGTLLFETLFPGEVRRLYDTARSRADGRLDVVFTTTLDWLADKPWELAYDPSRKAFLATEEVHFARNVVTAIPADPIRRRKGPLRILVAAAQPAGTPVLSTREEAALIRAGFGDLVKDGLAEIDVCRATTPEILHRRVTAARYDVLHFIGHGEYDASKKVGRLLFVDDKGAALRVESPALRQLLAGRGLGLVFLNACESGRGGRSDFNRGVAPALVAAGLPAAVANQYSVLDTAATAFARHFYRALAEGHTLGAAAREARIAVAYTAGETIDWAVPVLFARDPGTVLCPRR